MLSLTAAEMSHLKDTLAQRQPGHGLPRPLYHDELIYRTEMEFIWRAGWLLRGPLLPDPESRRLLPL